MSTLQPQPGSNPSLHELRRKNIEAIAKLEREALEQRNWAERFSNNAVKIVGSLTFLLLNVVLVGGWALINLNLVPGIPAFDRFPFGILALIVSAEGVLLTIFVLITQNRLMRQADKRAHLDLQVGMLAEQELTAVIQMLHRLSVQAGIEEDTSKQHAETFGEDTDVHRIAKELDETLPSE